MLDAVKVVPPSVTVMVELVSVTDTTELATALARETTPMMDDVAPDDVNEMAHDEKFAVRPFSPALVDAAMRLVDPLMVLLTKLAPSVDIVPVATTTVAYELTPVTVELVTAIDEVPTFPLAENNPPAV